MKRPNAAAEQPVIDALTAPLQPVLAASSTQMEIVSPDEVRMTRATRAYRVRGLARNLSAESLKITLRVSSGDHLHVDTLDLYQARARSAFIKAAAVELGANESVISGDISALVLALEPIQEQAMRGALKPENDIALPVLSEADEAAGLKTNVDTH